MSGLDLWIHASELETRFILENVVTEMASSWTSVRLNLVTDGTWNLASLTVSFHILFLWSSTLKTKVSIST